MKNQKKGFTLIELLVVIAIIGILSAIGLVALNGAREKARDAQRQSDLAQYRTALVLYYDDNNSLYPATQAPAGARDTVSSTGVTAAATIFTNDAANGLVGVGRYLGAILVPPGGGTLDQLLYAYDTEAGTATKASGYVLYSKLEGAGGTNYYCLDHSGKNTKPAVVPTCTGPTTCACL